MAEHLNDSYNRCLEELRRRYRDRGISGNAKGEIASQTSTTVRTESYVLFDAESKIADQYRSGEYMGSRYMTSDDFVRYFKTRRAFYMPATVKEEAAEIAGTAKNSAVPQRRVAARGGMVAEPNGKEGHLARLGSALKEFSAKWFPVERTEGRMEGRRFRLPASAMSGIAVFAVSLGLIVSGSVMLGNASGEVGKMQTTIQKLEAEQVELQGQLDLKYNASDIAEEAKSLGMIKRQYADNEFLTVSSEEKIIVPEDREPENVGLAALLASFGIELD
jgi:hypothetical protein